MVDKSELEKFRETWKNEIVDEKPVLKRAKVDQHLEYEENISAVVQKKTKNDEKIQIDNYSAMNEVERAIKSPNTLKPFLIAEQLLSGKEMAPVAAQFNDHHSPKLITNESKDSVISSNEKQEAEVHGKSESYLDIFLKDLEEINEIPFFDSLMPREIALNVFQFLDRPSLGACAQVSKAWRSIAEDELIWSRLCHRYGYELDLQTTETEDWKEKVREHLERRNKVNRNWMNRTGTVHELQHVRGGVLCCVHTDNNHIAAGYSTGDIKLWRTPSLQDTSDMTEGICIFRPSSTSLQIDERTESGTKTNHPTCVCVCTDFVASGYNQGYVDVWSLEGSTTSPIHSYKCADTISHICMYNNLVACASGNQLRLDNKQWGYCEFFDLDYEITDIHFLNSSTNDKPILALSAGHRLSLYNIGYNTLVGSVSVTITEIHHVYGHQVTCMASNTQRVAYALIMNYGWVKGFDGELIVHDLSSGKSVSSHSGNQGSVFKSLHYPYNDKTQHMFCAGAADKTVRVYDTRVPAAVSLFNGHVSEVTHVQMDDWKVVSGSLDGSLCVWDQRNSVKLWDYHNRHQVSYINFDNHLLLAANVPTNKFPVIGDWDNIPHKRQRGTLQYYNFSNTQLASAVPDICQSSYSSPDQYNYNVRLAVPYD